MVVKARTQLGRGQRAAQCPAGRPRVLRCAQALSSDPRPERTSVFLLNHLKTFCPPLQLKEFGSLAKRPTWELLLDPVAL